MDEDRLWRLIDEARRGAKESDELFLELLNESLEQLAAEEILSFRDVLNSVLRRAYRWDLWGAAYLINGGCSDDGFEYFRGWLVARGRYVFEAALEDPDILADHLPPGAAGEAELEEFLYLPVYAYEQKTGEELPLPEPFAGLPEPEGERFEETSLDRRYPRLSQRVRDRSTKE